MFYGQNYRPKIEIVIYLIITLLIEGSVDSNEIKLKFNISTKTFYRYMTFIKLLLSDYDFYYINIEYDRLEKLHKCYVNSDFKNNKLFLRYIFNYSFQIFTCFYPINRIL